MACLASRHKGLGLKNPTYSALIWPQESAAFFRGPVLSLVLRFSALSLQSPSQFLGEGQATGKFCRAYGWRWSRVWTTCVLLTSWFIALRILLRHPLSIFLVVYPLQPSADSAEVRPEKMAHRMKCASRCLFVSPWLVVLPRHVW